MPDSIGKILKRNTEFIMTQEAIRTGSELARRTDLTPTITNRILRAEVENPEYRTLEAISRVGKKSVAWLLTDHLAPETNPPSFFDQMQSAVRAALHAERERQRREVDDKDESLLLLDQQLFDIQTGGAQREVLLNREQEARIMTVLRYIPPDIMEASKKMSSEDWEAVRAAINRQGNDPKIPEDIAQMLSVVSPEVVERVRDTLRASVIGKGKRALYRAGEQASVPEAQDLVDQANKAKKQ